MKWEKTAKHATKSIAKCALKPTSSDEVAINIP